MAIYKRISGEWVKRTAYQRVSGEWIQISSEAPKSQDYLTFSSPSTFTINIIDNKKYWDGTLEYSTDARTWSEWDGTNAISSSTDGKLYMRGTDNTYITGSTASNSLGHWVLTGSNISCEGNIEYLLDYATVKSGGHPTMATYCYAYMFYYCPSLITAPELPATTLTEYCYCYMFYYTGMVTPPKLPATTVAPYCYSYMFHWCFNLTTPPTLPATTLAVGCYKGMFEKCEELSAISALPASYLYTECYQNMFRNCTKIKLSTTKTGNYQTAYRIPTSGTGSDRNSGTKYMFHGTGGTFVGESTGKTVYIEKTYYTSNTVV